MLQVQRSWRLSMEQQPGRTIAWVATSARAEREDATSWSERSPAANNPAMERSHISGDHPLS
jgi:hypothetical protein